MCAGSMHQIPFEFRHQPFSVAQWKSAGQSVEVLRGRRFRRLLPRVWVASEYEMSRRDWTKAAMLALPESAVVSHHTRLELLGYGSRDPVIHFTVQGDLHIDLPRPPGRRVMLHRTKVALPRDAVGVTPASAFVQCCANDTLEDLVAMGDWLLRKRHMAKEEVAALAHREPWRPGARQALVVLPFLVENSRSPQESRARARILACGLPAPELNVDLEVHGEWLGIVDFLFRDWLLVLEYEGRQHAFNVEQFNKDIKRYERYRSANVAYIQITKEMLDAPRALMQLIHQALTSRGYEGPAPHFGSRWAALSMPVHLNRAVPAQP